MDEEERRWIAATRVGAHRALEVVLQTERAQRDKYYKLAERAAFECWYHYRHPHGDYTHGLPSALPAGRDDCLRSLA